MKRWSRAVPLILGISACWKIWEQDIFNQLRSGDELLRTGRLPLVDSWTYSAAGEPWLNLHWLFTVAVRLVFSITGETYLPIARGALVALFFVALHRLIARAAPEGAREASAFALLPLLFVPLADRLQLRPELVLLIVYALLLATRRGWVRFALVLLAAQIHSGLAPLIGAMAALPALAENDRWCRRAARAAPLLAAGLLNPYGWRVFPTIFAHLFKANITHWNNPESASLLRLEHGLFTFGLGIPTWISMSVAASLFYHLSPIARRTLPAPYSRVGWFTAANLGLTALAVYQLRALPFQLLFLVPVLAVLAGEAAGKWRSLWQRGPAWIASWGVYAWQAIALLPLGLGVDARFFPVAAADFVRAARPQGNVLHTFQYGSYLVWALKEYPIFLDSRDSVYTRVEEEARNAFATPDAMAALVDKYGIRTVIVPIPPAPGAIDAFFPEAQWALAYFDATAIVLLRRTPEHSAIIERTEYRVLDPTLPIELYTRPPFDVDRQIVLRKDIDRCRRRQPTLEYCRRAHRALLGPYGFLNSSS